MLTESVPCFLNAARNNQTLCRACKLGDSVDIAHFEDAWVVGRRHLGGAKKNLVQQFGRVFGNWGTAERDSRREPVRFWLRSGHFCGIDGVAAAGSGIGPVEKYAQAPHGGSPSAWLGQANSDDVRKLLASDRCLSIGRR